MLPLRLASLASLLCLGACQRAAAPAASSSATVSTTPTARGIDSFPSDTHILDLVDSTEVWLTVGRVGRGPTGAPCQERGLQLRKGALRMTVPLLYTSKLPVVVHGKLVASLSTDCVSGDDYSIDPRTAQPTKLERQGR